MIWAIENGSSMFYLPVGIVYLDNHSRRAFGLALCSTVNGTETRTQPHHMIPTDGDVVTLMDPCRTLDVSLGCEVGLNQFEDINYVLINFGVIFYFFFCWS